MTHEEISLNTKKALAEALKDAMRQKPFQKITVSELIAVCGVNRKTFYYHFENIYALLKWMLEEEAIEVVRHFDLLVDYEEAVTFVMDYVEKNDHIINCAYNAIGRDELKRFFHADFYEIIISLIESAEKERGAFLKPDYKEFLAAFYTEAIVGLLVDWIREKDKRDREQVEKYLSLVIRNSLRGFFSDAALTSAPDEEQR